jgi:hypothetical protein
MLAVQYPRIKGKRERKEVEHDFDAVELEYILAQSFK